MVSGWEEIILVERFSDLLDGSCALQCYEYNFMSIKESGVWTQNNFLLLLTNELFLSVRLTRDID